MEEKNNLKPLTAEQNKEIMSAINELKAKYGFNNITMYAGYHINNFGNFDTQTVVSISLEDPKKPSAYRPWRSIKRKKK